MCHRHSRQQARGLHWPPEGALEQHTTASGVAQGGVGAFCLRRSREQGARRRALPRRGNGQEQRGACRDAQQPVAAH